MEGTQTWRSAQDYLIKNNSEFHSIGLFPNCDCGLFITDSYNNKIFLVDYPKALPYTESHDQNVNVNEVSEKLKHLAIKIKEHAEIFAELDFLIRKVPIEETKCNISLIVNNLKYLHSESKEQYLFAAHVTMSEGSPLASLGCVGQILMTSFTNMVINSCKDTAAVCYFFTQLCHSVGLKRVCLLLVEDPTNIPCLIEEYLIDFNKTAGLRRGCIGIITAQANVDAAVDALVPPSFRFPWDFGRIMVHTSIYNHFEKAVSEKVNNSNFRIEMKSETEFFLNNVKSTLVVHDLSDAERSPRSILVKIYENTEDLIAMLNKYGVFCMSVWTNSESEANAIAFGVEASFVWINDVNKFEGPPKISQCLYAHIELEISTEKIKKSEVAQQMITLRENWLRVDTEKRLETVCNAIKCCLNTEKAKDLEVLQKLLSRDEWHDQKITENVNGTMCIVKDEPVNFIALQCYLDEETIINYELLRSLVEGNAIVLDKCREIPLLDILKRDGAPIVHVTEYNDDFRVGNAFRLYKTKAVWIHC